MVLFSLYGNAQVVIYPDVSTGGIKPMNAVNNGPTMANAKEQTRGNFYEYKVLNVPFARIHDANYNSGYGGPHTVDISALFPDFDRDPMTFFSPQTRVTVVVPRIMAFSSSSA